jgi:tRNA pseudouridine38-40 synthase
MSRIALKLAYDGRGYPGWQTQSNGLAIQDCVERALRTVAGAPVVTVCAGRTDAGVHAISQVVHFECDSARPISAWVRGVNSHLPDSIAVQAATEVDEQFHARYSARRRRYTYLVYRASQRHPLLEGRAAWVFDPLEVESMREAAGHLVGRHDFSAFRSSQCQAKTPVRDLQSLVIDEQGPLLRVQLVANAFLHHMVRNIVGALIWIGAGKRPAAWMRELLQEADRTRAAPTFAPDGLYLTGVDYDSDFGLQSWNEPTFGWVSI